MASDTIRSVVWLVEYALTSDHDTYQRWHDEDGWRHLAVFLSLIHVVVVILRVR